MRLTARFISNLSYTLKVYRTMLKSIPPFLARYFLAIITIRVIKCFFREAQYICINLSETYYINETHHYSIILSASVKLFRLLVELHYTCYINENKKRQVHILIAWFFCKRLEVTCTRRNIYTGSTLRFLKVYKWFRKYF